MRFCCPNCGREEEILLDRNPSCRFCPTKMVAASHYAELWMSPYIAIKRMAEISATFGIERARKDGRFKREREAWTTGWFALALSTLDGEERWVEIETLDNTPDTRVRHINQSSGRNVIQTRDIEIVDWEENVSNIVDVISKKCRRAYPGNYHLLVNARHYGKVLDFDLVIEELKSIRSPFFEIWILAVIGVDQMKVVRVDPPVLCVDMRIRSSFENARKQTPFVQRGHRGTSTEFRDLGPAYLPLPKGD